MAMFTGGGWSSSFNKSGVCFNGTYCPAGMARAPGGGMALSENVEDDIEVGAPVNLRDSRVVEPALPPKNNEVLIAQGWQEKPGGRSVL